MKIGIMSMQRVFNYGSFLQAYALKSILENAGHEVVFVDYKVEPCIVKTEESILRKYARQIKNCLLQIGRKPTVSAEAENGLDLGQRFEKDMYPLLGISSDRRTEREKVDCLIIGSDEVFNCLQTNKDVGYSKELFGYNHNSKKLYSFAASFGNTTLAGLKEKGIATEIANLLKEFNAISVRDRNSFSIIKELVGVEPKLHIDPVFHYNYDHLIPDIKVKNPYMVVYAYPYRLKLAEVKRIKEFASKRNLKILCFAGPQVELDNFMNVTAFETLAYIKQAKYVVTDTFHGAVFSIKYGIPFVSIVRNTTANVQYGNAEKVLCLLDMIGLSDRTVSGDLNDLEQVIEKRIDQKSVQNRIDDYVQQGLDYIHNEICIEQQNEN